MVTLKLFLGAKFQRGFLYGSQRVSGTGKNICIKTTMKLTPKWKKPKTPVLQGFSAKEKVR
jgi:hypothetical protein